MSKAIVSIFTIVLSIILLSNFPQPILSTDAITEDSWATKSSFSMSDIYGGVWIEAAAFDGKIYCFGSYQEGYDEAYKAITLLYDPANDSWIQKTPVPTPRRHFVVAIYQDKVYVIGGVSGSFFNETYGGYQKILCNANEAYDPSTDTWQVLEAMPTERYSCNAIAFNGEIYVIGGHREGHNSITVNEAYNITNGSWSTKAQTPKIGYTYSSAVLDDKLYIFNGNYFEDFSYHQSMMPTQIYNPKNDSWATGAAIPLLLSGSAAAATSGEMSSKRIYVFGGDQGGYGMNYTQVYNPKNDSWSFGASMPAGREGLTTAVLNDIIYAIGGSPHFMLIPTLSNQQYTPLGYGEADPSYTLPDDPQSNVVQWFVVAVVAAALAFMVIGVLIYPRKRFHTK